MTVHRVCRSWERNRLRLVFQTCTNRSTIYLEGTQYRTCTTSRRLFSRLLNCAILRVKNAIYDYSQVAPEVGGQQEWTHILRVLTLQIILHGKNTFDKAGKATPNQRK